MSIDNRKQSIRDRNSFFRKFKSILIDRSVGDLISKEDMFNELEITQYHRESISLHRYITLLKSRGYLELTKSYQVFKIIKVIEEDLSVNTLSKRYQLKPTPT